MFRHALRVSIGHSDWAKSGAVRGHPSAITTIRFKRSPSALTVAKKPGMVKTTRIESFGMLHGGIVWLIVHRR
jgi:hypothetical protein